MTDHDNAYAGLLGEGDDFSEAHWAFGTGFDDPLAGVDTTLSPGVDATALAALCLGLADDALIHAQRLGEWVAHGPELEEEVALANIALDLVGQARLLYARAAAADPTLVPALPAGSPAPPEDALAFFRDAEDWTHVNLAELPRGDFAFTIARLLALSVWRLAHLQALTSYDDPVLSAIAARAVRELDYHRDHAARWLVTLANGTAESRRRVEQALADVAPWLPELLAVTPELEQESAETWAFVLERAVLSLPLATAAGVEGRWRQHTEHLAPLLGELQSVAREHPLGVW